MYIIDRGIVYNFDRYDKLSLVPCLEEVCISRGECDVVQIYDKYDTNEAVVPAKNIYDNIVNRIKQRNTVIDINEVIKEEEYKIERNDV